jgi:dethiobiotin synthetase
MIRLGITGTDTGVGKTLFACGLTAALKRRRLKVAAMKPVETGVRADDPWRDGARLARAGGDAFPLSVLAPIVLPLPLAPLFAAQRARAPIDLALLDSAVRAVSNYADVVLIEGAGGLLVPVADYVSFATLFARWALDLIIVGQNRLGAINHVRLTVSVARANGLKVRAVVLNQMTREPADSSAADNARLISELEGVPVFELPWTAKPDDLDDIETAVVRSGIVELIAPRTTSILV